MTINSEAGVGGHCATCSCNQNMTKAVRFDLSPAEKEGGVRDHLISLGWTPPEGGRRGDVVGYIYPDDVLALKDGLRRTDLWAKPTGQAGLALYAGPLDKASEVGP